MLRCGSTSILRAISRKRSLAKRFSVLALESSADDTCAAIVKSNREILSNVVLKQHHAHEGFGGIEPTTAFELHQKRMPEAILKALADAQMRIEDVDGIAFTRGPGMYASLSVGSTAARTMGAVLKKPIVGVHHMQAHALTALLTSEPSDMPQFPFLTLLVSGGHTLILLATSPTSFRTLATTADESIGRAFDKVSRLLEIPWGNIGPGAALERFCASEPGPEDGIALDIPQFPLAVPSQLLFSYSGQHSTVDRFVAHNGGIDRLNQATRRALASKFQTAALGQLEDKVALALKLCAKEGVRVQHLVVSGGVASNSVLRSRLKTRLAAIDSEAPISLVFPPPALCTDNAVMIAWASMPRFLAKDHDEYSIGVRVKWKIEDLRQ
ncbi:hypothetical protein PLICRDRAFT_157527 [Plicaturopsis crispa FD-325 SS-3]|nr:hypothetical protein PLICRDRAFT_157527 [Plicaturopsis crispa FD-325 SS-3]